MQQHEMINSMETYDSTGKFNPISVLIMLVLGGALGIGAAFIVHLVWQFTGFYLMVIFPAGIGVAAGFGLAFGVGVGKCRNTTLAMLMGVIIGSASYISMHYFDMQSVGAPDLLTYLNAMADIGYNIFFIPISGPFAWLTWIIEIGIVMFVTVALAEGSASEPFCEKCNEWLKGTFSFSTTSESSNDIVSALYNKKYDQLKELPKTVRERNNLTVKFDYCEKCKETGYLTLTRVTPGDKDDETEENEVVSYATVTSRGIDTIMKDMSIAN